MQNRQLIFSPKIPYDLVAACGGLVPKNLQFPVWWSILKVVRTHFAACGGEGLAKNSEPKSRT